MLTEVFQLKQALKKKNFRGLALDIDETLSDTILHWIAILQKKYGNPEDLTPQQVITKYRYTQNVPYWQTDEAFKFMQELREDNELQKNLGIFKQADKYVAEINKVVPIVAYITLRPEKVVPGTQHWLDKHHFPKAPIIAMPSYVQYSEGNSWKAEVMEYLYPEVQGIIDDNHKIIKALSKDYRGKIYLYDNPKRFRTKLKLINCRDWPAVITNLKKFYN